MICYFLLLTYASILQSHPAIDYSFSLPTFFNTFKRIISDPNRSVSLKCESSGNLTSPIKWKLDGNELKNDDKNFRIGDFVTSDPFPRVISYVNISSISVENGGVYECEASNAFGSVKHSARVDVKGKLFIRTIPDISATLGQSLIVNCPYSGFPVESISWLKNSNKLPINKRQEVFSNGSLIIHDVQKGVDDGNYTCSVTDGHQVVKKNVRMSINVGPMIDPFKFPEKIQEGMRARLVCTVIKGDPPFKFNWLKNEKSIESSLNNLAIRTDEFSSDLTFTKVSSRHNGNYTCVVTNNIVSTSHTASLIVDVPPYWKVEPSDTSVLMGSDILINCSAKGSPSPIISWEKGSSITPRSFTTILSGPHFEVYANGSLLIKMTEKDDAGFYFCQASNSIGLGLSKMITLTVHSPPQVITKFRSETVKLSENIVLNCDARGDSPMQIQWYLHGKPIKKNERFFIRNDTWPKRIKSSLKIESAVREDSDIFTCLVSNIYGKDEMNIHLTVQEPPESPKALKVIDNRSQEVKLSWTQAFNGNSEINRFWITCHPKDYSSSEFSSFGYLNMSIENLSNENEPFFLVRDLKPATLYLCSVKAENDVGLSGASNTVEFMTEEQAPEGPALNIKAESISSRSVRVSWNAPDKKLWNGKLKGYYIGYKIKESDDQYLYKTLEVTDNQLYNEVTLLSLKPFTIYSIIVQVYNLAGTGPRSDEVIITTLEDVPSKEPKSVTCKATSSESLSISWEPPAPAFINGVLLGYRVIYRPLGAEVKLLKKNTTSNNSILLKNLLKFTNYSIEVASFTRIGEGILSQPVYCLTDQDVPGPPASIKILISSADSVVVTWKDPKERNGFITQYAVYWQESNNNRTKSSVTIPKSRNIIYYRWPETSPQYKITSLRASVPFEVWVTAFTIKGEGQPTSLVTAIPTQNAPARILEWNETFTINGAEVTPFVLGCHIVGTAPIQRGWIKDNKEKLNIEADGSLLIQILPEETSNFTCFVSNEFGFDYVKYQLNKEKATATDKNLHLKVLSTSQTSAEIMFFRESTTSPGTLKDYELNYRVVSWNVYEWQIKPVFRVLDGNHTVQLDNLLCGTLYKLYISDLQTGTKSETITFQTQGSAPVAPRKEDMIKVISNSSIHIYPKSWDQSIGCPITKLIIEYRSSNHNWKMISSPNFPQNNEPILVQNLFSKTLYSIRVTAHTKGSLSTMAEYDVRLVEDDKDLHGINSSSHKGLIVDTMTVISFLSSLIVLIAGCFAMVCLIVYKKNISSPNKSRFTPYRRQSLTSYATSSQGGNSNNSEKKNFTRSDLKIGILNKNHSPSKVQSIVEKPQISLKTPLNKVQYSKKENKRIFSYSLKSPVKGRLPTVRIPTKQLEEIEKDLHNEYDEITPYATFRLNDDDPNLDEEFKTFSIAIGEPDYLYKLSSEATPTTSRNYKVSSSIKSRSSYHSGMINSQSITSGSSNQDELLHAYKYGRQYQIRNQSTPVYFYEGDGKYSKSQNNLMETPIDPGIREFTKSPPKPNEKRLGACFNPDSDQSSKSETELCNSSTASEGSSSSTFNNGVRLINIFDDLSKEKVENQPFKDHLNRRLLDNKASGEFEFKTGLSSDEDEFALRKYYRKKNSHKKSKHSERHSEIPLESGQHSLRHKSKQPLIRTKSKSNEIEC